MYLVLSVGRFSLRSYQFCCRSDSEDEEEDTDSEYNARHRPNFCEKALSIVFFLIGVGLFVLNTVMCILVIAMFKPDMEDVASAKCVVTFCFIFLSPSNSNS